MYHKFVKNVKIVNVSTFEKLFIKFGLTCCFIGKNNSFQKYKILIAVLFFLLFTDSKICINNKSIIDNYSNLPISNLLQYLRVVLEYKLI